MESKQRLEYISNHYDSLDFAEQVFRGRRAKTYFERVWDKELNLTMSYLVGYIPRGNRLKALDIGCSSGRYVRALCAKGVQGVGIDTAIIPLIYAKQWVAEGNYLQASITNLPFAVGTFDIVICMELLHHLPDDVLERSLEQIAKVVKHEGIFIFDIKNKLNPVLNWAYRKEDSIEFTLRARTVRELSRIVEAKGFKVVKRKGIFFPIPLFAPYVVCYSIRRDTKATGRTG